MEHLQLGQQPLEGVLHGMLIPLLLRLLLVEEMAHQQPGSREQLHWVRN